MATKGLVEIIKGIFLKGSTTAGDTEGEIRVDSADSKLKYHNDASESAVVTEDHAATLTNKTIDGASNTITNIAASGVAVSAITNLTATDAQAALAEHQGDFDTLTGSEVANIPAGSVTSTNVQDAINEISGAVPVVAAVDVTVSAIANLTATNAQAALAEHQVDFDTLSGSDVINTPTGNISATDVQAAITELDTEKVRGSGAVISNQIPRYNGASGVIIRSSGVTVDSSDNMIIPGNLTVNGTETIVNTTNLDVTDKNITVNDTGNDASSEGAGLTVERTSTDGSIIYADAAASKFLIGPVGSEVEVVDLSSNQVITGKDIDGGTASNILRLTVPKNTKTNLDALTRKEATLVWASDENKLYTDNGAALVELGAGGGSTPDASVSFTGDNGFGSTNTSVRKWTNVTTVGADLTATQSATLGDIITVNTAGLYSVSNTIRYTTTAAAGVSLNSIVATGGATPDSTNVISHSSPSSGLYTHSSRVIKLSISDVLRAVSSASAGTDGDGGRTKHQFSVIRIG